MAKEPGSKSKSDPSEADPILDAEIVEEISADVDEGATSGEEEALETVSEPEAQDIVIDEAALAVDEDAEILSEPEPEPEPELPPQTQTVVEQRRAGLPAIVGGAAAAVIGFAVAQVVPNGWPVTPDPAITEALTQSDQELAGRMEVLEALISDAQQSQSDALSAAMSDLLTQTEGFADDTASALAGLSARVDALEARPIVDLSSLDNSDVFEAELEKLRADIRAVSAEANAQIEAARNEATLLERNAAEAAAAAAERAALSRVLAALDSGVPFAATLAEFGELSDTNVPDALLNSAADGVATLAKLQEDFPPLSREALAAMRNEEAGDTTLGNFFRNQFGARSLTPQGGTSPDAILSRIEAATTEGRLTDAVAEAATLPESGQTILAPWIASVETRQAAFAAAQALTQSLTSE